MLMNIKRKMRKGGWKEGRTSTRDGKRCTMLYCTEKQDVNVAACFRQRRRVVKVACESNGHVLSFNTVVPKGHDI